MEKHRERCGEELWLSYNQGFDRISNELDQLNMEEFIIYFFGLHVPKALSKALFYVFDTKETLYISRKEFLCGLTILLHGTIDERLAFLFTLYNEDGDGILSPREMQLWLNALRDIIEDTDFLHSLRKAFKKADKNNDNNYLSRRNEGLDFKQFKEWALSELYIPSNEEDNKNLNDDNNEDDELSISTSSENDDEKEDEKNNEQQGQKDNKIKKKKTMNGKKSPAILTWIWDLLTPQVTFDTNNDLMKWNILNSKDESSNMDDLWSSTSNFNAFTTKEIHIIENTYHQLLISSPSLSNSSIDLLKNFFPKHISSILLQKIANYYEINHQLNSQQFLLCVSLFIKGSIEAKYTLFYELFKDDLSILLQVINYNDKTLLKA